MSTKQDDLIDFQALELEEGDDTGDTPTFEEKLSAHLKFLKENMEPEKYTQAVKGLGLKADLSNEDLLEQFRTILTQLLKGKEDDENDDDDDSEDMMSYKDFMKECMKGEGKTVEDCAAEWKEKYPEAEEPSKEEIAEITALAKKKKDDDEEDPEKEEYMKELEDRVKALETKLAKTEQTSKIEGEVNTLIEAGHLAPSQKEGIIQLAGNMGMDQGRALLDFFRNTQKIGAFTDKGHLPSNAPGGHKPEEIPEERRKEIMDSHGILNIIQQRGSKKSKAKVNN